MFHGLSFLAIAVFLSAAATDWRGRRIPNTLVLTLAALALARIAMSVPQAGSTPLADLAVAALVFAVGAGAFQLDLLGGGDVKLMAAGALWTGAGRADEFLMVTVLAGGVLALAYLARGLVVSRDAERSCDMRLPYGIAIAFGGVQATGAMLATPDAAAFAQAALSLTN